MKQIWKKLSADRAETIAELLAAALILSLGLLMLAGAMRASACMIRKREEMQEECYEEDILSGEAVITVYENGKRKNIAAAPFGEETGRYPLWEK